MAIFCIPKNLVEKLKKSALKGEVDIQKLYDMTSTERRAFFEKYTDANIGKFINTEFESAMASKKRTAFVDFTKSLFSPKEQARPVYKSVLDKIKELDNAELLSPNSEHAILEDLISDKLGVSISPKEIEAIRVRAEKIDKAQVELGDDLGNPNKTQENVEFWKAKKEMDDYLAGLTPTPILRIATGTTGRAAMLASVKSPILNIGSNIEIGFTEALSRRIAGGQFRGANNKLAVDYVKMVNKIYQATGYDVSRMTSMVDTGASGARVLGEDVVHAQGPGAFRKVARIVAEDIVFKQMMGAPDVAFSSAHFADSVNLNSMKMAKGNKVKASEIMTDAMRLEPKTPEGEILRTQGILDAQTATWTDKSWAADVTEKLRRVFNEASGDARLGDILFPFIRTPSNVIATGMDYAGTGLPKAMYKTYKAIRTGELGNKQVLQGITRDLVRSGLGITGALMVTSQLKDEDFVGAYDPARAQIEQLRNSNYNAIRIGGKWISTDWLGPLAVPVTSMMYARKYGKKGWAERVFQYTKGTGSAILNLPVISDIYDYVKSNAFKKDQTLEEMTGATADYLLSQLYSRIVPSFMSDLAKATDTTERQTGKGWESIKAKIPFLRQTLPEKKNIFGETIKGEPVWSDIAFGSRLKTDKETEIISEINRVSMVVDKGINFTNWDKSSSKTLAQFKEKKGQQKFDEAKDLYGKKLKEKIEKEIEKGSYKKLTDEEKLKILNNLDSEAMNEVFKKYNFKYKQQK
jgi:hypothetical protein